MKSEIREFNNLKNKNMSKTNRLIFGASLLILSGSLMFTSCRKPKKEEEKPDQETSTASDNANMENISADMDAMSGQASETGTVSLRGNGTDMLAMAPGATVTGFSTSTITVDFGAGVTGPDGRTRSGKLFFDLSGCNPSAATYYRNPGFKCVITSQNYVVDGNAVTITNKTIQNTTPVSVNSQTVYSGVNLTWHITANISVTNGTKTVSWNCDRTKELINSNDANCYHGQLVPITWSKAIVRLNGTASGVNAKQEQYSVTATNLVRDFNCSPNTNPNRHPFISGTMDYKPGSRPTRHIDYGNGGCDNAALITVNGVTYSFDLP
jgi:hypothetical protein